MEPTTLHKVKLLELCRVAPPFGRVTKLASFPLTFLDLPLLLRSPPQLLYFYNFPNIQITQFKQSFLPQIKHSLTLTLQYFYPLAGNLTWTPESGKPFVTYIDGDYVEVTIAESINGDFNHLSDYHARDSKALEPLAPQLLSSGKQVPILAIQITLFPSSGICIGITLLHAALDGRALALFMKSWASISRLGNNAYNFLSLDSLLPFYDREGVIKNTIELEKRYLQHLVQFIRSRSMSEYDCNNWVILSMDLNPPPNQVAVTFELGEIDISRLKQYYCVKAAAHQEILLQPSRFELACAYIWICLVKARNDEDDKATSDDIASFIFAVDYRSRLDPPLPGNYFGNCAMSIEVSAKKRDIMGEDGIVVAVNSIRKEIRGLSAQLARNSDARFSRMVSKNNGPKRFDVIAGSPQFGYYTIDFGWGRPKKVEMITIAITGAILLGDGRKEDGGIEISLVRTKKEMDAFGLAFVNGLNNLVIKTQKKVPSSAL